MLIAFLTLKSMCAINPRIIWGLFTYSISSFRKDPHPMSEAESLTPEIVVQLSFLSLTSVSRRREPRLHTVSMTEAIVAP